METNTGTPKPVDQLKCWAYFAPDGFIQVRSIGETKKQSQKFICAFEEVTHKDYEKKGYVLKRIIFDVKIIN